MYLEDSIRIGVAGMPHAGKDRLTEAATKKYPEAVTRIVEGNFWVPDQIVSRREGRDKALFEAYSQDPDTNAFPYQVKCLASRLLCQQAVDNDSGIVWQNEPLPVERATYGEANRKHMGDLFPIYKELAGSVIARTKPVHVLVYLQIKEEGLPVILRRIDRYGRDGEKKFLSVPSYLLEHIRLHEEYMRTCRTRVITVDATHPAFDKDNEDPEQHLRTVLENIVQEVRKYKAPPRLDLGQWVEVGYDQFDRAQEASRVGRRQLRKVVHEMKAILSTFGPVSGGKTTLAAMIADMLDINLSRELSGRNDEVVDSELFRFLDVLAAFQTGKMTLKELRGPCYDLQVHYIKTRPQKRRDFMAKNEPFIEDRSIEEDREIFWRLFHEVHGSITAEQYHTLCGLAEEEAGKTTPPDLYIGVLRSASEASKLSRRRGRDVEQGAWPLSDMEKMVGYFDDFIPTKEPRMVLDMDKFKPDSEIHRGWLWQEMMHHLLIQREVKRAQGRIS